ncbi:membrane protein [Candidatus Magnetomorum sp. HK-1]|nr:membrane protein [Candidatus Magnetomorum sp. HK-1]
MHPTDKFRQFELAYHGVVIAGIAVSSTFLKDFINTYTFNTFNTYFIVLMVAVISIFIFEKFLLSVILEISYVKKRIWGNMYMEGTWIDCTFDAKNKNVFMVNILTVVHKKQMLIVFGENFNSKGESIATFELQPYRYNNNGFNYWFEWIIRTGDSERQRGFGACDFGAIKNNNKYPNEHKGHFRALDQKKHFSYEGKKLIKTDVQKLNQEPSKKEFLCEYIKKFAGKNGFEIDHNIESYFLSNTDV